MLELKENISTDKVEVVLQIDKSDVTRTYSSFHKYVLHSHCEPTKLQKPIEKTRQACQQFTCHWTAVQLKVQWKKHVIKHTFEQKSN